MADASALQVSPDELKAAILLFYSLLDGNNAAFSLAWDPSNWATAATPFWPASLGLDPHTVARGRQQLLDHNVAPGRTRRFGGGRKPVEKKPPTLPP